MKTLTPKQGFNHFNGVQPMSAKRIQAANLKEANKLSADEALGRIKVQKQNDSITMFS